MMKSLSTILTFFVISVCQSQNVQTATNGLYHNPTTGTAVRVVGLGGTLIQNTTVDLGASFTFGFKKGSNNYLSVANNGNIGIRTSASSLYPLQVAVPAGSSTSGIINVTGLDYTFNINRYNQAVAIPPTIGFDNQSGLTWYNDGFQTGIATVDKQKIVNFSFATPTEKFFRVNDPMNNLGNYSLEFMTTSTGTVNASNVWYWQPSSASIIAYNRQLNIGSASSFPVKIYSDGGNPNKIADIFIQSSKVGIGTETPNANAKLDVNGNIFSNGKIAIGTTDMTQIGTYALAVNGDAIFNKVKVKLYGAWADYVFENGYELPTLASVESYILQHKRLPDVPSAIEVAANGIDVEEMQTLLLKKVEELTLYMIEMNKKVEKLEKENETLKTIIKNN